MIVDLILLVGALAVLVIAGKYFVSGVSGAAAALGVPQLVIGMTVVAFGTSAPELVVNSLSAWRGSTDLAFGNIVGSCILNVGFVLAITAIIRPLKVEPSLITREIPMLLVAVAAIVVLASDRLIDHTAPDQWGRSDGLILLLFFAIFLYYTTRQAVSSRRTDIFIAEVDEEREATRRSPIWRNLFQTLIGLIGLSLGADWTVDKAVVIARHLGVSETIIGLTIVSLGTTLPELTTCIVAARRDNPDIAVGNIVGSNIFNLLCIGGLVSLIRPVPIPEAGHADLVMMTFLSVVLFPIAIRSQRTLTRGEGAFLLFAFVCYFAWRLWTAASV